ncbi:MAG: hypothetical protein AAGJ54_12900 [Planctomycetota bacterium]
MNAAHTNVQDVADRFASHAETVSPGLPYTLTGAHSVGDVVHQGDLILEVAGSVPDGYVEVADPDDRDRQLVPFDGNPGSHHRLRSFQGVRLFRPEGWGQDETDLRGPAVVFASPNAIVHESGKDKPHGTVEIANPMTIVCTYQRNLDAEGRAARARD